MENKKLESGLPKKRSLLKNLNSKNWRFWMVRVSGSIVIITFSIVIGIFTGVMASSINALKNFGGGDIKINSISDIPEIFFSNLDKKINVLVLGSDYNYGYRGKRLEEVGRSDTIMLTSIDPKKETVNVLSIPRDTKVIIHGYSYYDKINAALAYGGPQLAIDTVKDLTGVPIDYYVLLKPDGVEKFVDLIGGVDIYVEKDMYYVDETAHLGINIHKGWKHMNGAQAHQFIRFRKDTFGDIGRIQRQQQFIRAVMNKLFSINNLLKIPQLIEGVKEIIETNLSQEDMIKIANFGRTKLKKENIKMVLLPGRFAGSSNVSYWEVNQELAPEVILDLFPESELSTRLVTQREDFNNYNKEENSYRKYKLTILNGSKEKGLARVASNIFKEAGWTVWSIENAPRIYEKSEIIAQTGKTDIIPQINQVLGIQAEKVAASTGDILTDFTIILGEDYAQLQKQKNPQIQETQNINSNVNTQDVNTKKSYNYLRKRKSHYRYNRVKRRYERIY